MRRWGVTLIALLLLGGLGMAGAQAAAALPPLTIEEAVAVTLRGAGAPTAGLRVEDARCVPARETCLSYIADVRLGGERAVGRLACAAAWRGCTLTLAEYGLRAAPVPALGAPHPLARALAERWRAAEAWLRAALR